MRLVRRFLAPVVLASAGLWALNPVTPAQPAQNETKNAPVPQDTASVLTEADRSLACPAESGQSSPAEDGFKTAGTVKPPKPAHMVNATFTDEARRLAKKQHQKPFEAISWVRLVVDAQGNPQNICVLKPAGFGLDGQAVKAAAQYKFEPATKDGTPIPARITMEVNFRLY
jgi:TonB family protein